GYDLRFRYNQTPQNIAVSSNVAPPIFYCPSNALRGDRVGGTRDTNGFACADYVPLPYVQLNPDGSSGSGYFLSALTGQQYPGAHHHTHGAPPPGVTPAKMPQLAPPLAAAPIDALFGLPPIADIVDGPSTSIIF